MVSALRFVKLRIIGARRTCSTVSLRLPRLPRVASKIPSSNRTDGFADSIENSPARKANETMSFRGVVEKSPALETARYVSAPAKCPRWLTAEKSPAKETARHEHAPSHSPVAARHRRSSLLTFPLPARNIVGPLWLKTVTCGLFLRHFVPPRRAGRFLRSFHSLGMTNYNGVRSVLKGLALKPSVHP